MIAFKSHIRTMFLNLLCEGYHHHNNPGNVPSLQPLLIWRKRDGMLDLCLFEESGPWTAGDLGNALIGVDQLLNKILNSGQKLELEVNNNR